jgi:hypothetical protein
MEKQLENVEERVKHSQTKVGNLLTYVAKVVESVKETKALARERNLSLVKAERKTETILGQLRKLQEEVNEKNDLYLGGVKEIRGLQAENGRLSKLLEEKEEKAEKEEREREALKEENERLLKLIEEKEAEVEAEVEADVEAEVEAEVEADVEAEVKAKMPPGQQENVETKEGDEEKDSGDKVEEEKKTNDVLSANVEEKKSFEDVNTAAAETKVDGDGDAHNAEKKTEPEQTPAPISNA